MMRWGLVCALFALALMSSCEATESDAPNDDACTAASHGVRVCGGLRRSIYRCVVLDGVRFVWWEETNCYDQCDDPSCSSEEYATGSCKGDTSPSCVCSCRSIPGP